MHHCYYVLPMYHEYEIKIIIIIINEYIPDITRYTLIVAVGVVCDDHLSNAVSIMKDTLPSAMQKNKSMKISPHETCFHSLVIDLV